MIYNEKYNVILKFPFSEWKLYVHNETDKWAEFHKDWFSFKKPKLILFYQELKSDLRSCLRQICQFLKTEEKCTPERIDCVLNNSQGNFHRKKSNLQVSPYTEDMLENQK